MILVNEDNIDSQPVINLLEALNELEMEYVTEFSSETSLPVGVVSTSYRIIRKHTGKTDRFSFMIDFTISIIDETVPALATKVGLMKAKLKAKRDGFESVNMDLFDFQGSSGSLDRNGVTYPVKNFTYQYVVQ